MKRNLIETLLGAIVLIVAGFFVFTTYQSSGIKKDYGYKLIANFDKVDGISAGSDVRLGGIKIGTVVAQRLNPDTYRAELSLGLDNAVRLPTDSTAAIVSDGLLGGKYISIAPGAEVEMLKDGNEIEYTQSSVNLEQLIGKIAFGGTDSDKKAEPKTVQAAEVKPSITPSLLDEKPAAKEEPKHEAKKAAPLEKATVPAEIKPPTDKPLSEGTAAQKIDETVKSEAPKSESLTKPEEAKPENPPIPAAN